MSCCIMSCHRRRLSAWGSVQCSVACRFPPPNSGSGGCPWKSVRRGWGVPCGRLSRDSTDTFMQSREHIHSTREQKKTLLKSLSFSSKTTRTHSRTEQSPKQTKKKKPSHTIEWGGDFFIKGETDTVRPLHRFSRRCCAGSGWVGGFGGGECSKDRQLQEGAAVQRHERLGGTVRCIGRRQRTRGSLESSHIIQGVLFVICSTLL
eukprot:COSAG02_NODE_862_length_16418_cov_5.730621_8_plen_205_part_00